MLILGCTASGFFSVSGNFYFENTPLTIPLEIKKVYFSVSDKGKEAVEE